MIYTIGHSNHAREAFMALLMRHQITALADVRSVPYSRRHPDYNREVLKEWLKPPEIAYVFLGEQLGGRSQAPADFTTSQIDYRRLKTKPSFAEGLERLRQGMTRYRIALLCAEKDPLNCHRGWLLAPELEDRGMAVCHILADGRLERHRPDTEDRLLEEASEDLFTERSERLVMAYRQRAGRAA